MTAFPPFVDYLDKWNDINMEILLAGDKEAAP